VIPAEFDYVAPTSLEEALAALRQGGEDAKLLAGGHSLLPLMKLRLAAPSLLVDLRKVPGVSGIKRENGVLRIGAMTRHVDVVSAGIGLASQVATTIADPQVRNRGTIGGSVAHGDPASDLPGVLLAAEGSVIVRGQSGEREIAAGKLFRDHLTTAIGDGEILTEVRMPTMDNYGFGFRKFTRRKEDWAVVGVCAWVRRAADGSCDDVRIGLTNMGSTPLRASAAEDALRGRGLGTHTRSLRPPSKLPKERSRQPTSMHHRTTSGTSPESSAGGRSNLRRRHEVFWFARLDQVSRPWRGRDCVGDVLDLLNPPPAARAAVPALRSRSAARCSIALASDTATRASDAPCWDRSGRLEAGISRSQRIST
jgi:carbon-monoxide dehydrogenase medium subunit